VPPAPLLLLLLLLPLLPVLPVLVPDSVFTEAIG